MSVTYKFSKAVTLITGQTDWSGPQWAYLLLTRLLLLNWGLPAAIISNRDRRFVGQLWKQIMNELKVDILYSTTYHPQTDGQSEKSNKVVEIVLRYFLLTVDRNKWPVVLPQLSAALNNSTKYSSTRLALIEVLYGFKIKEPLDLLRIDNLNLNDLEVADVPTAPMEAFRDTESPGLGVRHGATEAFRGDAFPATVYRPEYIDA